MKVKGNCFQVVLLLGLLSVTSGLTESSAIAGDSVKLEDGDHISLVGNALASRMQYDGWLETLIQDRFPKRELSFRNLGYSTDELGFRMRVQGFGSRDKWLSRTKTDVIFAFYGFNESFGSKEQLDAFRSNLKEYISHVRGQKYNGDSAPKLVLFSPIAHEKLGNRNLPDGAKNNRRIRRYTRAMEQVAQAKGVTFVDLFHPTLELYATSEPSLTINGVHLNTLGNRKLARLIDQKLFGAREEGPQWDGLEKLRQAVLDKNFYWLRRYRTTDGYNVYGGRSHLEYEGITNREVLQREMEVLDVMTANRQKRVWAVAQGKEYEVDDSNTPPFIEVETNKPGPKPDGSYPFLGPKEAMSKMELAEGMEVNLFASEKMFPELVNPVQMAFDTEGRLWVAAWRTYPHWKPKTPMNDKLLILEDSNGDGMADKRTVFADNLHDPTGFEFYNGGVVVAQAPNLVFLKDTDGDDKADLRKRLLHGLSSGDTHHTANSFVLDPGGALYFQEGVFHRTQIETPYGPVRNRDAAVWRFEPKTWKVDRYIPYNFANPHGHVFDKWGQDFVVDGTGAEPYHGTLFSGHLDFPDKHPKPPQLYQQRTRPCPGITILSSDHFPKRNQGNLLVGNVIGFRGILQYRIEPKGSSFVGTEIEPIIRSSDPNFRPADMEIGPDGALYFTDWHNPLIGHMQHHIRDPNRDTAHGRVYRITYPSRPLLDRAAIDGQPIEALLDLLKRKANRIRYRAKIELSERDSKKVAAHVEDWIADLDRNAPRFEHHMMEALWVYQYHNVVNEELLRRMLESPNHNARAAATRVLCYWRDRVSHPLKLVRARAKDDDPLVRLEAVRACSFFRSAEAAEIALLALKRPMDKYLRYTLDETMRQLKPYWKGAVSQGKPFAKNNPEGINFILDQVSPSELLNLPKTRGVYRAMLTRPNITQKDREEAVEGLAKMEGSSEVPVLLNAIERADKQGASSRVISDLATILTTRYDRSQLVDARNRLETLAGDAESPVVRQVANAALVTADQSIDRAWELAEASLSQLRDFVNAVGFIGDPKLRNAMYPKVESLVFSVPEHLETERPGGRVAQKLGIAYYKEAPPNAELETFKGLSPTTQGETTAINLDSEVIGDKGSFGLRFSGTITIPKDGEYTFFTNSDDGSRLYVDRRLVVNNDGDHGPRERSGTIELGAGQHELDVTYYDQGGRHHFEVRWKKPDGEKEPIPAAALGYDPETGVHRAAISALALINAHDNARFNVLARCIRKDHLRPAAIKALLAMDPDGWKPKAMTSLAEDLLDYLKGVPSSKRTEEPASKALELTKRLAANLPKEQATKIRKGIEALRVQVIVIEPVHQKLRFKQTEFTVTAGRPVEIVFKNSDVMPHNLVITKPGKMQKVGIAGMKMAAKANAFEKGFVPDIPAVLHATELLQPQQSERLRFTAPEDPDDYPYVCTFPGHWQTMNGMMHVVSEDK